MLYGDLTYELRKVVFVVRQELEVGWSEEIYHQCLVQKLYHYAIPYRSKERRTLNHLGVDIHIFEYDLSIWDKIILELKVLPFSDFAPAHYAQIIQYLKFCKYKLGLLVNSGPTQAIIKRVVWEECPFSLNEDYEPVRSYLCNSDRAILYLIRETLLKIGHQYNVGYPATIYRTLIHTELLNANLTCTCNATIPTSLPERSFKSDQLLVQDRILLNICALYDRPPHFEKLRLKTYLKALNLPIGLLINFGKKQLQIYGVNRY